MAIETVNGYICTSCSEVAQAKRGIDPQANAADQAATEIAENSGARAPLDFTNLLDKLA